MGRISGDTATRWSAVALAVVLAVGVAPGAWAEASDAGEAVESASSAPELAGTVFADVDGDGVQQEWEPTVSGVAVQLTVAGVLAEVTTTDVEGRYALTHPGAPYDLEFVLSDELAPFYAFADSATDGVYLARDALAEAPTVALRNTADDERDAFGVPNTDRTALVLCDSQCDGVSWVEQGVRSAGYTLLYHRSYGGIGYAAAPGSIAFNIADALRGGIVQLPAEAPGLIVLNFGGNDATKRSSDAMIIGNLRTTVAFLRAKYPAARIVVNGVMSRWDASHDRRRQVDTLVTAEARRLQLLAVSVAGWASDFGGHYLDDVHLSQRGHNTLAAPYGATLRAALDTPDTGVRTGWTEYDGTWFFQFADASWAKGWLLVRNSWYLLDRASGAMRTGWTADTGRWWYLNDSGVMLANSWVHTNGRWYWLGIDGAMATGWVRSGNAWYFLENSGAMGASRWVLWGKKWYWLDAAGRMVHSGAYLIGGKRSVFGADGAWLGYAK